MGELTNYSIETDQLVWLSFKSGQNLRVTVGQLPHYLSPHDLKRVRRAIKLRRDFFRNHMPKTLIILLALGLTALAVTTGQVLAAMWHAQQGPEPAGQTEIVRNALPAEDSPSPAPTSTPTAVAPVAGSVARTAAQAEAVPKLKAPARKLTAPSVSVTPLPAPGGDSAALTAPTPAATPTPIVPTPTPIAEAPDTNPNNGEVLGDSTGPDGSSAGKDGAPVTSL